ncbi:hypothetical protein MLD38_027786 [Melastoma candidum]|uniref:Uncharacterized protein n=1 Tax=Melastoma candidum TaxID=119954 RepID=A0ACB9P2M4_9MYRT|nr:hypothetical protein MLD38_027786 [Melastoma candidum]
MHYDRNSQLSGKWIERVPYGYWKGNPYVDTRRDLLKCNVSEEHDRNARLFVQMSRPKPVPDASSRLLHPEPCAFEALLAHKEHGQGPIPQVRRPLGQHPPL